MNRIILHCDLNCFFASVEMLMHKELRNVPMAVAGDPQYRHGIILAKNVPARKCGVRTAETIQEARKKCPELIIRKPDYAAYEYYSGLVRDLYDQYTDQVEPFGIDECWLDISSSIAYFGSVQSIVDSILRRVKEEIGLTLSIGIADNKVYAKLGSDLAAEDSFRYVSGLSEISMLPAGNLLNVGIITAERLKTYGIFTIGDIAGKPVAYLEELLGKCGRTIHDYACGKDDSPVDTKRDDEPVRSISNTMTSYRDLQNMNDFRIVLSMLCDSVACRLRNRGMYFKTVHLFLRDKKLKSRTLQTSLAENSDLSKDIYDKALFLFKKNCDFSIPWRSIGVAVSNLSFRKEMSQIGFFDEAPYSLKQKKEETAIQTIRERFGSSSILPLRQLEDERLADLNPKKRSGRI